MNNVKTFWRLKAISNFTLEITQEMCKAQISLATHLLHLPGNLFNLHSGSY
jgi:hypothetical protein